MKLQGIFVPIVIPFDHNGAVYKIKVQHNVEKWNRAALTGYVVCGDEGIYLSSEEKIRVWQWVAEHAAPEKILIAAAGQPSVHETVELANRAETMGYKAIVVRGPSAIYFRAVADRARLPVIVDGDLPEGLDAHPNVLAYIGKIGVAAGVQRGIQSGSEMDRIGRHGRQRFRGGSGGSGAFLCQRGALRCDQHLGGASDSGYGSGARLAAKDRAGGSAGD